MSEVVPWMLLAVVPTMLLAGFLFSLWLRRVEERKALEPELRLAWRDAVRELRVTQLRESKRPPFSRDSLTNGLGFPKEGPDVLPWLSARLGPLGLNVEKLRRSDRVFSRITVSGMGLEHGRLSVARLKRPRGTDSEHRLHGLVLGEAAFDSEFEVWGEEWVALAVLNGPTRNLLADLLRGFVYVLGKEPIPVITQISQAGLEVEVEHNFDVEKGDLYGEFSPVLAATVRLAQALCLPSNPAARLAFNLAQEPEAGVRVQITRVLARQFADQPRTIQALERALEDPDPNVRLVAAAEQGRLGKEVPESQLLAALAGAELETSLAAAEALSRVGRASAVPALHEAERRGPRELSRACQQAIAAIHARVEGAEVGQLTLTDSDAGSLSLAEEREAGRVSLAEGTSGELPRLSRAAIAEGR